MTEKATVRFIAYLPDDRVRVIRLSPGRPQEFNYFSYTDEGFRLASSSYHVEDDTVIRQEFRKERDCDGLYEDVQDLQCHVADLRGHRGTWPLWDTVDQYQRDYSAEAMGY